MWNKALALAIMAAMLPPPVQALDRGQHGKYASCEAGDCDSGRGTIKYHVSHNIVTGEWRNGRYVDGPYEVTYGQMPDRSFKMIYGSDGLPREGTLVRGGDVFTGTLAPVTETFVTEGTELLPLFQRETVVFRSGRYADSRGYVYEGEFEYIPLLRFAKTPQFGTTKLANGVFIFLGVRIDESLDEVKRGLFISEETGPGAQLYFSQASSSYLTKLREELVASRASDAAERAEEARSSRETFKTILSLVGVVATVAVLNKAASASSDRSMLNTITRSVSGKETPNQAVDNIGATIRQRDAEPPTTAGAGQALNPAPQAPDASASVGQHIQQVGAENMALLNRIDRQTIAAMNESNRIRAAQAAERERARTERDEREAQRRREAAREREARERAAREEADRAARVKVAAVAQEKPFSTYSQPQVVIEPTRQTCPPGFKPAGWTTPSTAVCLKDPQSTAGQNGTGQGSGSNGGGGNASGSTAGRTQTASSSSAGNSRADSSSSTPPVKQPPKIKWGPVQLEAYAICYKNEKIGKWWCDGPIQDLILIDEPTVEKALDMVGCDFPISAGGGTTKKGKSADVYRCGFGLRSDDRDIRKIHGVVAAPNSYMCPGSGVSKCTTIYAGQDKQ